MTVDARYNTDVTDWLQRWFEIGASCLVQLYIATYKSIARVEFFLDVDV